MNGTNVTRRPQLLTTIPFRPLAEDLAATPELGGGESVHFTSLDSVDVRQPRQRPGATWQVPPSNVLPASVDGMDFPVGAPIREALSGPLDDGDLDDGGLGGPDWPGGATPLPIQAREFSNLTEAIEATLHLAVRPGDGAALHTPAFGPFGRGITGTGRRVVPIPMQETEAGWMFDAEALDRELVSSGVRALVLVNPHNPTGRAFTRDEPQILANLVEVERHDLLEISGELHAELIYEPTGTSRSPPSVRKLIATKVMPQLD